MKNGDSFEFQCASFVLLSFSSGNRTSADRTLLYNADTFLDPDDVYSVPVEMVKPQVVKTLQ